MAETTERHCPDCGTSRAFVRAARTTMDLGTKTKWRCPECGFSVVNIEPSDGADASA